jgi:hypothetical protein
MTPADRSAHWRLYRQVLAVLLSLTLGAPLVLHLLLMVPA